MAETVKEAGAPTATVTLVGWLVIAIAPCTLKETLWVAGGDNILCWASTRATWTVWSPTARLDRVAVVPELTMVPPAAPLAGKAESSR